MKPCLFSALLTLLLVSGCQQGEILNRVYDFEDVDIGLGFGRLNIASKTHTTSDSERHEGSPTFIKHTGPYTFKIAFLTDEAPGKPVQIKILDVIPEQGRYIDLYKDSLTRKNVITYPGRFMEPGKYVNNNLYSSGYDVALANVDNGHTPFEMEIEIAFDGMVERVEVLMKPRIKEKYLPMKKRFVQ